MIDIQVESELNPVMALDEPSVHVDTDGNSVAGIPTVVQVISVIEVLNIHIVAFVPVV